MRIRIQAQYGCVRYSSNEFLTGTKLANKLDLFFLT